MIKIQADIINTRKGQDWAGRRTEHTQPSRDWVLGKLQLLFGTGTGGSGEGTWWGAALGKAPSHTLVAHVALLLLLKEEWHFLSSPSA